MTEKPLKILQRSSRPRSTPEKKPEPTSANPEKKATGILDKTGVLIESAKNLEMLALITSMQMMERALCDMEIHPRTIEMATEKTLQDLTKLGFNRDELDLLYEYNLTCQW